MPDKFSREKRSQIMSKIRSRNTDIELDLKNGLEKNGIIFEFQPKMFGKPDFLIQPRIVVFCDSSFWHGRNWNVLEKNLPQEYWREHIKRNIERDKFVNDQLKSQGFIVLRFWDYQIKKDIDYCINEIRKAISNTRTEVKRS